MEEEDYVPTTPQERILAAALTLIEREDPRRLTSRAIAAAAGVNVAAINYYYRTKEALIEAALSSSWDHAVGHIRSFLEAEPWDPRAALRALGEFLLEGGCRHPVVARTMLFDGKANPRRKIGVAVADMTAQFADRLARSCPRVDAGRVRSRLGALVAALVLPALVPDSQPWLATEAERAAYLGSLVDDLLTVLRVT